MRKEFSVFTTSLLKQNTNINKQQKSRKTQINEKKIKNSKPKQIIVNDKARH